MAHVAHSIPAPFRASVWLLLIFTPFVRQQAATPGSGRVERAEPHLRRVDDENREAEVALWTQLIERVGCREVQLLDSFQFLVHRPIVGRQLFARLAKTGHRLAVRRHLDQAVPLLPQPPLHRLAIIVPIVMKPTVRATDALKSFLKQLARDANFRESHHWMFVVAPEHDAVVQQGLREFQIRADSSVYWVRYRRLASASDGQQMVREMVPIERHVPRMQTIHPEVGPGRARVELTLPLAGNGSARVDMGNVGFVAVRQLYRLQTRTRTIEVAVDLLGLDETGRMVLYRALGVEQRNDFFHLAQITLRVFSSSRYINSTYMANNMPLFRNARIILQQSSIVQFRKQFNLADFQFYPVSMYNRDRVPQRLFTYSIPIYHDHVNLYLHYADVTYEERSHRIILVIMLPCAGIGALLCLALLVAFNVTVRRNPPEAGGRTWLTLSDALLWFIGVITQQGSLVRPNSLSTMVLIAVALFFSSIMYCSYLSRITSQLSVDVEALDDLDGLLRANVYQIGFVGNFTKNPTFFWENLNPSMPEVMRRMQQDKTLYAFSIEEGIERVLTSKYALIAPTAAVRQTIENYDEREVCKITELNFVNVEQHMVLRMATRYAYRKMVNFEILRFYSHGLADRVQQHMIPPKRGCLKGKQFEHITVHHIQMHMLLLTAGFGLAVLVLGLELIAYYSNKLRHLLRQQQKAVTTRKVG